MDAIVDGSKAPIVRERDVKVEKPSREEAEAAVRTLISWAGDNPEREGLIDTPKRVVNAYTEFFAGYDEDPEEVLGRTFEDVEGYDDMVMLRDIAMESHCEHHMVAILGKVHIAYMPVDKVVGISKLARVIEIFAKRLQTQETMTAQIVECIERVLRPRGVAIVVDAKHQCMTTRGIKKPNVATLTSRFTGAFADDARLEARFFEMIKG